MTRPEPSDDATSSNDVITSLYKSSSTPQYSLSGSYRRRSIVSFGAARPMSICQSSVADYITEDDMARVRQEEINLMEDSRKPPLKSADTAEDEDTSLLGPSQPDHDNEQDVDKNWADAVQSGQIKSTWQREAKTLIRYSAPLTITSLLQYSLTTAGIFTVGHIGKVELGAVSLASMTANITGFAVYQGLSTSLDTLCAQAYGSGQKHLVGIHLQRMIYFLWLATIPIALFWYNAEPTLNALVPEKESARLAAQYLKVVILGTPGYAAFESGKRFVQAQGMFSATTYVLLVAAPLNGFLAWLFVWQLEWGFIGAPIALAITHNVLPLLLFLYVVCIDGRQCWGGLTPAAFRNWYPMVALSIPGFLMLEAEFVAFEIMILASSYFSSTHLAAQSILSTVLSIAFQIPFPISIAACTRVANLVGATLTTAAKTSTKVAFYIGAVVGLLNFAVFLGLRTQIARLFTNDEDVVALVVQAMPVCAVFQLYNSFTAIGNGLLRGLGRQAIGSYVNLGCYYVVALPISFGLAFGLHWQLQGLWIGVDVAMALIAIIEGWILYRLDWEKVVQEARCRDEEA